jgi:cell division inhibitor SepF
MGLFKAFKDMFANISQPYEDDYDDIEEQQTFKKETTPPVTNTIRKPREPIGVFEQVDRADRVVKINATAQLQVVLVKPDRFEAVIEIANHLRERRTVMLNLEDTEKELARRIVDFAGGATFVLDGKIKKVSANTFIITPYNVDLMGNIMDELESTGMSFF